MTGVAGFVGSHVAEALLARGDRVLGLDNFDHFYARPIKERNLAEVRAAASRAGREGALVFQEVNLTDPAAVRAVLEREGVDGVIHLAGKAGVRPSLADPVAYMTANVTATQAVLSAATASGARRAVLASSSSVYGNSPRVPFREDDPALEPISPYAASKRATELIAFTHHHAHGLPIACLRFFTVYGPRQRPDLAIHLFMSKIRRGEPIAMFGDGSMARDYTFVTDTVRGVLAAYDRVDRHGCRTWNLGSDRPTRLDALLEAIQRVAGRRATIERKPAPPGDVEQTWADLSRSAAELGYAPSVGLEEGLTAQWAWMERVGA